MKPLEADLIIPPKVRVQIIVGETKLVDFSAPIGSILIYSINLLPSTTEIKVENAIMRR